MASESKATLELSYNGTSAENRNELLDVLENLETHFYSEENCDRTILFGYFKGTAVGIYIGSAFGKSTIRTTFEALANKIADEAPASAAFQLCGNGLNANHVFGVALDTTGGLSAVQRLVSSWSNAECVTGFESTIQLADVAIWKASDGAMRRHVARKIPVKDKCETHTVAAGDSCGALATACGISPQDFTKYNPAKDLCSTLAPGQRVCCTAGELPDIRPKPNKDGTCATYLVASGDTCASLAATNGLKPEDIDSFNNGTDLTWGWSGCGNLMKGMNICLSDGDPPMPAPVANAICGPTVPGTTKPTNDTKLADLNPCPLKACCNIWGQCGISGDFCVEKRGPSGNPGTAPPNVNGCVSSCGTEITNDDEAPGTFNRVGYYEAWNLDRDCVQLLAQNANTDGTYTHMHWAFANIDTSTWSPTINDTYKQWDGFKSLSLKKIISFGGWGFSTEPATYDILRQAVGKENRGAFVDKIVEFLNKEGLDGVDIDWEYPGAPDIPGIPPGKEDDGINYLEFLKLLRSKIPKGKSISIAAPASYWYLKAFPIDQMAKELDYIVYMTYDLHGQWDYGNKYSMDGCEGGNCLRSHVNLTETMQVLAMITKAGVPTKKIMVGESSYGRSFGMSQAGCTANNCTFEGSSVESVAEPGACTNTAGYISNAEINDIIAAGNVKTYHDGGSNSDILVYDDFNWVAYMSSATKDTRRSLWQGKNFAGTIDWAVDLQAFADDGKFDEDGNYIETESWDPTKVPPNMSYGKCAEKSYGSLDDLSNDSGVDNECRPLYIVQILEKELKDTLSKYDDLMRNGYDGKFNTYSKAVVEGAPKDVRTFMMDHGNDYFSCVVTEWSYCCSRCGEATMGLEGGCDYCFDGECEQNVLHGRDYTEMKDFSVVPVSSHQLLSSRDRPPPGSHPLKEFVRKFRNVSEPCPPDYSKRGVTRKHPDENTVYWTLRPDRHDQFFADLFADAGIKEENIAFIDKQNNGGCNPPSLSAEECRNTDWDIGIPAPQGYEQSDVLNPKDTITSAHDRISGLPGQMSDALDQMKRGEFGGLAMDLVDALSMPVFMVSDALDQMGQIVEIADEMEKAKRQAIIFAFLSALFFFIPVAGEVAGAIAGMAGIARIASLIGTLGTVAMDAYDIVNTPENAPLAIFDLILAPLALGDITRVSKAASIKRGMSQDDIGKLGGKLKSRLDLVEMAKGACLKKRDFPLGAWPMSGLNAGVAESGLVTEW